MGSRPRMAQSVMMCSLGQWGGRAGVRFVHTVTLVTPVGRRVEGNVVFADGAFDDGAEHFIEADVRRVADQAWERKRFCRRR